MRIIIDWQSWFRSFLISREEQPMKEDGLSHCLEQLVLLMPLLHAALGLEQ